MQSLFFGSEFGHFLSIVFFNFCLWVIVLLLLVAAAADVDDIYLGNCRENVQRDSASNYCLVTPSGKTNGLNKFTMNCFLFLIFCDDIYSGNCMRECGERKYPERLCTSNCLGTPSGKPISNSVMRQENIWFGMSHFRCCRQFYIGLGKLKIVSEN